MIDGGRLFYRGGCTRSRCPRESRGSRGAAVAMRRADRFRPSRPHDAVSTANALQALRRSTHRASAAAALHRRKRGRADGDLASVGRSSGAGLRRSRADSGGMPAAHRIDTAPSTRNARGHGASAGAELIRMALVLCADHELNASSFTGGASRRRTRACAPSWSAAYRLVGRAAWRHHRARRSTRDELGNKDVEQNGRASRPGDGLPGFGHALYPDGDVRATYLLSRILPRHPQWKRMIDTGSTLVGQKPSLDLALVALRRHLRLPVGAAFGLFALGRSIGWIAHGLEQREQSDLIRPRAVYTGLARRRCADPSRSRGRAGKQQTTQPAAPKDDMLAAFFRSR